jgi:hypothetical protein
VDRITGFGMTGWALAGLAALIVAGVMIFAFNNDKDSTQTANNTANRPAATAPANPTPPSTTGSGSTTDSR